MQENIKTRNHQNGIQIKVTVIRSSSNSKYGLPHKQGMLKLDQRNQVHAFFFLICKAFPISIYDHKFQIIILVYTHKTAKKKI